MIEALLFDADGVLFFHTDKLFSTRIVEEYGTEAARIEKFFTEIYPDCIIGTKDLKQELSKELSSWRWPGTVEELMDYWYTYEHNIDAPLVEHICSLNALGIPSYVATNNDHYRASWLFKALNIDEQVFSKLFAAGDMGVAKPNDRFFELVFKDLPELTPAKALFWDDTQANVDAARAFGMQAELYTDYEAFKQKMVTYVG